jgi:hypothetical protein
VIGGAVEHDIKLFRVGRTIDAALVQAIDKAPSYHVSIVVDCLRRYCQAMTRIDTPGTSRAHLPVYCEIGWIGPEGYRDPHRHIRLAKVAVGDINVVLHGAWERSNDFGSWLGNYVRSVAMNRYPRLINAMRADLVGRLRLTERFN